MAVERDTSRFSGGGMDVVLGQPLTEEAFSEVEGMGGGALILLDRNESVEDAAGMDIPLGLGPTCDSS